MPFFDLETWRTASESAMSEMSRTTAAFAPRLVAAILLLLLGWLVARLLGAITRRLLRRIGLDTASTRLRVRETLDQAAIRSDPSALVGRLVFWLVLLGFLLSAVEALGLSAVTASIGRLLGYLPNLVAALVLVLLGVLAGRLARNVVASAAAAADFGPAARLGAAAQVGVVLLVTVLALEQIGIETEILVSLLTALVAASALTVGLSFALGARPVVTHILAGHFLRQSLAAGGSVEVEGRRGVVERVGPVETLLRDERGSWSIPNGRLLETVVGR